MLSLLCAGVLSSFVAVDDSVSSRFDSARQAPTSVMRDSVTTRSASDAEVIAPNLRPSAPRPLRGGSGFAPRSSDPDSAGMRRNSSALGNNRLGRPDRSPPKMESGAEVAPQDFRLAVSGWGERIGFQVGLPLRDSSSELVFGLGGAYSIDNSRFENVRSRTAFREISASCDYRQTPVWGANGSGWEAFYEVGWHMRFLSHHAVVDSEEVVRVYEDGRYQDRVMSNPHVVDYNGVAMQPYFGIGASQTVFGDGIRFQVRLGTGPEWLFAGSHSRFGFRSRGAIGLDFRL